MSERTEDLVKGLRDIYARCPDNQDARDAACSILPIAAEHLEAIQTAWKDWHRDRIDMRQPAYRKLAELIGDPTKDSTS
jgi:hypothetical protein